MRGKLAIPQGKDKAPQLLPVDGWSRLVYDERVLEPDEANAQKTVRVYHEVEFRRMVGTTVQDAGIRPSVRRMVLIRAGDRRAPFSPDGPLTWGEIDVVRTDVFTPAAVPGLLPAGPVKAGQKWPASPAAVAELTDMEKVDEGGLTVEFVGVTAFDGKRLARLRVSGTVRGVNEDGPNRQKLEGTAFFDLDAKLLTRLSVKGTHELLDGTSGQTMGSIDGSFEMTRTPVAQLPANLSDASLRGLSLKPEGENTLLLYDDARLGLSFLYPRGWRVGAVQGKQLTLDHARLGGGILVTVEPAAKVPSADGYLRETRAFLEKEKARVAVAAPPQRIRAEPITVDRFALDVAFGADAARMEYAVLKQTDGGATVAARFPAAAAADLRADLERIVRSMSITRRIE
ncbi:MAG TPA: hypothetical protein VH092_17380 [Urbifossiella sp.]|nr:hypothetical protein [Urbifossiella sp.]